MNSSERTEQVLPGNWLARWQEENIELMRRGFDVIAGTGPAWWKPGKESAGDDFFAGAWIDSLAKCCRDMTGVLSGNLKTIDYPVPWDAFFNGWKRMLAASPSQSYLKNLGMDSGDASKSWQAQQSRFFEAWTGYLEGIARVYEPGGEGDKQTRKALDVCRESSGGIVAVCRKYTETQMKDFFDFLESFQAGKAGSKDRRQAAQEAEKENKRKTGR